MNAAMARAKSPGGAAPEGPARELWRRLCGRVVSAVRDANIEAGEPIWTIDEQGESGRLEIRSAWEPSSAELVLDEPRARVTCRFGARAADRWRFQILGARMLLRRASDLYDVRAAVDAILGHLVGTRDAAGPYCVTFTVK